MTKNELGIVMTLAGVGAAAFFLLRPREPSAEGSLYVPPIYGTGTALREPVPVNVGGSPSLFDKIVDFFTAEPKIYGWKSPQQWRDELRPLFRRQEQAYAMPTGILEAMPVGSPMMGMGTGREGSARYASGKSSMCIAIPECQSWW